MRISLIAQQEERMITHCKSLALFVIIPAVTLLIGGENMKIDISSTAFKEGEAIPSRYSCDGDDISPPLAFSNVPDGTASLALICDDPDAPMGIWVHWVLYNLPPQTRSLNEGMTKSERLPDGSIQGISDFKRPGYGGPCPPGGTHRYFFKIYALDTMLSIEGKVTKEDLLKGMDGHILAEGSLMGRYSRKK